MESSDWAAGSPTQLSPPGSREQIIAERFSERQIMAKFGRDKAADHP